MAEFSWKPTTPLSRILLSGRHGATHGAAGISLTELRDFELIQIMARRGQWQATAEAAARLFGVSPPAGPQAVTAGRSILIWSGPDQFLALSNQSKNESVFAAARQSFAGLASLSDQSDGRALIRIAGPDSRTMLAKLVSLDLHPQAFASGSAAATSIDHTGVNFWRGDDAEDGGPTFYILVFSTFAESLWNTMLEAAAEYGVDINQDSAAAWLP